MEIYRLPSVPNLLIGTYNLTRSDIFCFRTIILRTNNDICEMLYIFCVSYVHVGISSIFFSKYMYMLYVWRYKHLSNRRLVATQEEKQANNEQPRRLGEKAIEYARVSFRASQRTDKRTVYTSDFSDFDLNKRC
jgi:hypothetical protein